MIIQFRNTVVLQRLYHGNSCNAKTVYNSILLNYNEHSIRHCEPKTICFPVVLGASFPNLLHHIPSSYPCHLLPCGITGVPLATSDSSAGWVAARPLAALSYQSADWPAAWWDG